MSATLEQFEPSASGAGKIGTASLPWGEGRFIALYVNGQAVAPLASPALTGVPTAPTASPGTSTTQLATTAFATAGDTAAKARGNHTGTQLAATISDFSAAVAATNAGTKAHTQGSDTALATGTGNEVTAAALRTHLDDAGKHREINDSATSSTGLWSSDKTAAAIAAVAISEVDTDLLVDGAVTTAKLLDANVTTGKLADDSVTTAKLLDANVTTAKVADSAITTAKVAGGSASPGNSKYWGTSNIGVVGFHTVPNPTLGALASLNTVGASQIDAGSVIEAKIASNAVTADKIATGSIITAKILDANVTADKIASNAVVTAKLADASVTTAKVAGGSGSPGNLKYWGTNGAGAPGFYDVSPAVHYVLLAQSSASGTAGGSSSATTWTTRTLAEILDDGGVCTVAANLFTLAAGTYRIAARAPAYKVGMHRLRLYNVTGTAVWTTGILAPNAHVPIHPVDGDVDGMTDATLFGQFTIGASTQFRLDHWTELAITTSGLGVAASISGVNEVYATVELWKIG
jgi:hypothetical protein